MPNVTLPRSHRARDRKRATKTVQRMHFISTDSRAYIARERTTDSSMPSHILTQPLSQEGLQCLREDRSDRGAAGRLNRLEVLRAYELRSARQGILSPLTVPHHGPAAHQRAPSQTPDCCISHRAPWTALMQAAVRRSDSGRGRTLARGAYR